MPKNLVKIVYVFNPTIHHDVQTMVNVEDVFHDGQEDHPNVVDELVNVANVANDYGPVNVKILAQLDMQLKWQKCMPTPQIKSENFQLKFNLEINF